jgi:hypothetical protein
MEGTGFQLRRNMSDDIKLTGIRVEYHNEMTVNIGDFQNLKPGFSISADVPEGVSPTAAKAKLEKVVDAWLEAKVNEIKAEL